MGVILVFRFPHAGLIESLDSLDGEEPGELRKTDYVPLLYSSYVTHYTYSMLHC